MLPNGVGVELEFHVLKSGELIEPTERDPDSFVLEPDSWNDWFQYQTLFTLGYIDSDHSYSRIGPVKIAKAHHPYGTEVGDRTPLEETFSRLDGSYASVGQDASYYNKLAAHFADARFSEILRALQDLALEPSRIDEYPDQIVLSESLFRSVSRQTARSEFNRLITGQRRYEPYAFTFVQPSRTSYDPAIKLEFQVDPESKPPSNVHALIGRNGSGKSRLLHSMVRRLVGWPATDDTPPGEFRMSEGSVDFGNIVVVSFSAFDQPVIPLQQTRDLALPYVYVGLRKPRAESEGGGVATLTPDGLVDYFLESARSIVELDRVDLWMDSVIALQSDQNFEDSRIADLVQRYRDLGAVEPVVGEARQLFSTRLSSGHKIVLLTITRLVETVVERSLVLLDEPEAHLHPPLLAAFVRALSDLLMKGNGVAIAATHSPVILQEVPQHCAWVIVRNGEDAHAIRPIRETFGEGVGLLTHDVFELEVMESGFYQLIQQEARNATSAQEVLEKFHQNLGSEARLLLHSWFASRSRQND